MSVYTVHAGHAADGKSFSGAVGYVKESVVDREIKDSVIKWLSAAGHTCYDCTVDSGSSQSNVITQIKKKINSHRGAAANISIHLNALSGNSAADGKIKGVECCVYALNTTASTIGSRICVKENTLGFTNRGVKKRTDLGVLKGITNGGANVLVECFFCDDEDDVNLFLELGVDAIGKAIAEGITGKTIVDTFDATNVNGVEVTRTQDSLDMSGTYKLKTDADITKTPNGAKVVTLKAGTLVEYEGWYAGEFAFVGYKKVDGTYTHVGFIHGSKVAAI